MRRLRQVALFAAATALALTALGAPASAADTTGTLVIVHGSPGIKIDICIGNKEQRSGKAYGSVYEKDVIGTGARLLRIFKYNPDRTCGGTLLAQKVMNITPGWDRTFVFTKFAPRIIEFDNAKAGTGWLGEIPPRGAPWPNTAVAFRNGSDMEVDFYYEWWTPNGPIAIPPQPATWSKNANLQLNNFPTNWYVRLSATLDGQAERFAQRAFYTKPSRRVDLILVGSNPFNARFVTIIRGISQPSP